MLVLGSAHQLKNAFLFSRVIERVENPDFVHAPGGVQRVEQAGVLRGEFRRLEIAAAEIRVGESVGIVSLKKVEAKPAAVGARDPLRLAEERNEQEQHEVGIDARL